MESWITGPESPSTRLAQIPRRGKVKPYRRLERITSVSIFFVSIYSTLLSGAWLAIAIGKPNWDNLLRSDGSSLTFTNASTLATALAKTIELSFLTSFLAMMGQYLTRKASNDNATGISLAELELKILLVQPGTLVTRWKSYSRSLLSILGLASLVACLSATFYTTASDALGKSPSIIIRNIAVVDKNI